MIGRSFSFFFATLFSAFFFQVIIFFYSIVFLIASVCRQLSTFLANFFFQLPSKSLDPFCNFDRFPLVYGFVSRSFLINETFATNTELIFSKNFHRVNFELQTQRAAARCGRRRRLPSRPRRRRRPKAAPPTASRPEAIR